MSLDHQTSPTTASQTGSMALPSLPTRRCRIWHRFLSPFFSGFETGQISIALPSGGELVYGPGRAGEPKARITIHAHRALWRILSRGMLGVAESFMDGQWSCDNLSGLFDLCLKNRNIFETIRSRGTLARLVARIKHLSRANSLKGSRRNIAYHYDLGNDFYQLWLDPTMTYSSAYHLKDGEPLDAAQTRKLDQILSLVDIDKGQTILEIGCGWGGFAERAAQYGYQVDGLTLSQEQLEFAIQRAARGGFSEGARFHLRDYRMERGQYDAIVSIEMIEAVGEEHWPTYFKGLYDNLRPGGKAVLQAITIEEADYERYRKNADFIQTFIFPGGMLPTERLMDQHAREAGLEPVHKETFGLDYAHTLARWRETFLAQWPKIKTLGYDEHFKRMWEFYLAYCEAGFANGTIDVGHYAYRRP